MTFLKRAFIGLLLVSQAWGRPLVLGYFPEWATVDPACLSWSGLDVLNLAFAIPDSRGGLHYDGKMQPFQALRKEYPHLRLVISLGGWNGSQHFSKNARSVESRRKFARNAAAFVRQHQLDGLDLDWEYPEASDRRNYTLLLQELRRQLGPKALLMAAVSPDRLTQLELKPVMAQLDWLGLMTYDMQQSQHASHHAALYPDAARGVETYLRAGLPAQKLLLGIPAYGHLWKGQATTSTTLPYREIVQGLASQPPRWIRHWDAKALAPWLEGGGDWISYDDPQSVAVKVKYVESRHLGGWMIWELSADSLEPKTSLLRQFLRNRR